MSESDRCSDCGYSPCACEIIEARDGMERVVNEHVGTAERYRRQWQAAAAYIRYNGARMKPRGPDERRMLALARETDLGPLWSGKTDGWIK